VKNDKDIIVSLMILVILALLGAVIGFRVGYGIDFPSSANTPWRPLAGPVNFSHITDISNYGIWVQNTDGKLYFWGFDLFCYGRPQVKCNQWIETKNIPDDAHKDDIRPMSKSKNCIRDNGSPTTEPPGKIVECVSILKKNGPAIANIPYALLDDGTIWYWTPPIVNDSPILTLLICPSIGLFFGGITGGVLIYLRVRKKKQLSSQV